ncbi:hypothetical protein [Pseudaestuariivita atlantica]|uniref:hypothetical protein n=1 Tax=Pseudaestuariivita atlantica TaxID=1317121 RepID=UPI001A9499BC|nr:hypothetical protein [Pseudaestuariivita atlantica]
MQHVDGNPSHAIGPAGEHDGLTGQVTICHGHRVSGIGCAVLRREEFQGDAGLLAQERHWQWSFGRQAERMSF